MSFWLINGCLIIIYSFICWLNKKDKVFLILVFLHLTVLAALRGVGVGTDTFNYCRIYRQIVNGSFNGSVLISKNTILYYYYKIVALVLRKENGYMISTSVPTMAAFYILIKKYVKNYYLGVFFFVSSYIFFFSMNAGRQLFAVAATIVSFVLWNEKKTYASLFFYLIAIQIHNSAIIFGVFFLVSLISWTASRFLVFSVCTLVACKSVSLFTELFIILFPKYRWLISNSFIYELSSKGRLSVIYASVCVISIIMMLYWIMESEGRVIIRLNKDRLIVPQNSLSEDEVQFYYSVMAMLVVSGTLYILYPTVILFTRISYFLFVYFIILLTNAIEQMNAMKKTFTLLICTAFFAAMIYQLHGGYSGVLDYRFYGF